MIYYVLKLVMKTENHYWSSNSSAQAQNSQHCLHKYGLTDRTLILYPQGTKAYLKLLQILPAAHAN